MTDACANGRPSVHAVLKRQYTNAEPDCASTASRAGLMAPPLPVAKRVRDGQQQTTGEDASRAHPVLRRQLTPRISWSSLLGDSSEDAFMEASSTEPGAFPSLPSSPVRGGRGSYVGSPPARPTKSRGWTRNLLATPSSGGSSLAFPVAREEGSNRFEEDFEGAKVIGSGNFAVVYRARNRIDKQEYAIKQTKNPLARGHKRRKEMLQEALALASVAIDSPCPYVVRYFGSWIEDDRLFIQTELCDGSLKDSLISLRRTRPHDPRFNDKELTGVIQDVCMGLAALHAKNLVHLDVKPENILVKSLTPSQRQDGIIIDRIHKIADLGLATAAIGSGCDEINEGDSRYLAREVLRGDFSDLTKADVLSLGLVCYELATNPKELPCNGEEWHRLRDGDINEQFVNHLCPNLVALMRTMIRPVPEERPACVKLLQNPSINLQKLTTEDVGVVEELQEQLRLKTEAAERERLMRTNAELQRADAEEKADRYWNELLHMKRQEMLRETGSGTIGDAQPSGNGPSPLKPSSNDRVFKRSFTA